MEHGQPTVTLGQDFCSHAPPHKPRSCLPKDLASARNQPTNEKTGPEHIAVTVAERQPGIPFRDSCRA